MSQNSKGGIEIRIDAVHSTATVVTSAAIGATVDGLNNRPSEGNTDSGWVNIEINAGSTAADTSNNYQFLAFHDFINSDGTQNDTGNWAKVIVRIQHHRLSGSNLGGGI